MSDNWNPMKTGLSRVFVIEDGVRADRAPIYHNFMRAGPLDQSYGDVSKIEAPHPTKANQFIEIGEIQGAEDRPTTQIVGIYPLDEASVLKRIADRRCVLDIQFNLGQCIDISLFDDFEKKLILEDVRISNYGTDDLGTLGSDGRAQVNETSDLSIKEWYEVLPLDFSSVAGSIITNEVIDVVICDAASCGECESPSSGCEKIFALTAAAGGSPSTPADIVYSLDGGSTWQAVDIDTLAAGEQPNALACVAGLLVVISNDSNSLHYADLDDFTTTPAVTWTEVSTGFVVGGEPNDIWSIGSQAFVVGDGGYIYTTTDPTAGVTVLDAGVAVQDNLLAVHAISEFKVVAVGEGAAIVKTENGTTFSEVTPPVGVGVILRAIWIKENNSSEWFFGGSNGTYHYTVDNGVTFTVGSFPGSGSGNLRDIVFATKTIGYLAHDTTTPAGRIFRTYDGGRSWDLLPEGSATLSANDRISALAACIEDANFVVGVGLADDGADGIILVGQD